MKRLAIFASGTGTNFDAIVNEIENGTLDAKVCLMVCDKKTAKVIEKAKVKNIDTFVFNPKEYESKKAYDTAILEECRKRDVEWIILAGYMRIVSNVLLDAYPDHVLNIHPALLPSFKGAHGIEDAYNYGCKVMGVTVHYVSEELDGGKIIDQKAFEVGNMTLEEAECRIHEIEHVLYPDVIRNL